MITLMDGRNEFTVQCENPACRKEVVLIACSHHDLAPALHKKGWGWINDDEWYDHFCSETCRMDILERMQDH